MRLVFGRLTVLAVTFGVIVTLVFLLLRLMPGGPFDGERALPPEAEANLMAAYHLDEPLPQQFLRYVTGLLQGDLGPSFRQKDFTVNELVAAGLPVSLTVGSLALLLALALGLSIGTLAALRPGSVSDSVVMGFINLGLAVPAIVAAPVAVLVFAVALDWVPAGGIGTPAHYLLPVVATAMPYSAAIARLWRGSVLDALQAPHVLTARAKGLPASRVLVRHVFPGAASGPWRRGC